MEQSILKHCHSSDTQQAHPCVLDGDICCTRKCECRDHMDVNERTCRQQSLTYQCLIPLTSVHSDSLNDNDLKAYVKNENII